MAGYLEHEKIAKMAGISSVISDEIPGSWMIRILQKILKIIIMKERYSCAVT